MSNWTTSAASTAPMLPARLTAAQQRRLGRRTGRAGQLGERDHEDEQPERLNQHQRRHRAGLDRQRQQVDLTRAAPVGEPPDRDPGEQADQRADAHPGRVKNSAALTMNTALPTWLTKLASASVRRGPRSGTSPPVTQRDDLCDRPLGAKIASEGLWFPVVDMSTG
ncbi:hypothetical protein P3T36_002941 [Kitasatospora sp. MAP12-15]|uniref:hypothetical protein n=1 Tax=unclassified Kitasatospora TaxID=2633591 RepID=UPI002475F36A|nr:hypothetical protein [Kitasatospora sp. MAP12-44]MDH6114120.1 hypothetical protein [Kitasatospora sp. MAP12-44]